MRVQRFAVVQNNVLYTEDVRSARDWLSSLSGRLCSLVSYMPLAILLGSAKTPIALLKQHRSNLELPQPFLRLCNPLALSL